MKKLRKRYYVDGKVQYDIIKRFLMHWILFVSVSCLVLTIWTSLIQPDSQKPIFHRINEISVTAAVLFITLLTLLPYFVHDAFKLTNRFAGPMLRLHRTIKAASRGEEVQPIRFREGDYWQEVAEDFSEMMEYYQSSLENSQTEVAQPEEQSAVTVGPGAN